MKTIFTLEKLYAAYQACRKNKQRTINALRFEFEREKNLLKLLDELQNGSYEISKHICFIVTEPKPREIFAANFRDRVVHHLLHQEIEWLFESTFSSRSFACRKGFGTHVAMRTLRDDIKEVKRASGGGWCLKLDVQSFFPSIDKNILYSIIERGVATVRSKVLLGDVSSALWCQEILWLCKKIIFHDPTTDYLYKGEPSLRLLIPHGKSLFDVGGTGLPIGNLTSQFFANVYLNELDQFVIRDLHCSRYVRYVDDFVIVDENREYLASLILPIMAFLQERLGLTLHPKKIRLQPTRRGVDFLGYFVKPTHTLVRQSVVRRFKNKLNERTDPSDGLLSVADIPMIKSYFGHFSHANTYRLRKRFGEE